MRGQEKKASSAPQTLPGRLIGLVFLLMSTGLLALLIGLIAASFTDRLLPGFRLWRSRKRRWYVFSNENAASRALADRLDDGLVVFCRGKASRRTQAGLSLRYSPEALFDQAYALSGERVFFAALLMGFLGFLCFQFMIKKTVIRVETDITLNEEQPKFNVIKAMANFLKNRPAVGATVAAMGMFLGQQGAATAVTVLFQSYFKNAQISGLVSMFAMIPIIVFTPLARKMVNKYGKKELATVGAICSMIACGLMLVLPITPDSKGIGIYVVCQLLNSLGMGVYSTVSWAMMGDAIDYNEWKTGNREEGTVYALHSFFRKLAQGVGPALALVVMTALGYVGTLGANQTPETALNMRYLVAALYLLSAVMQFVGLGLIFNLNKKNLATMNAELKARHEAKA